MRLKIKGVLYSKQSVLYFRVLSEPQIPSTETKHGMKEILQTE
jgi:hypothetical protein